MENEKKYIETLLGAAKIEFEVDEYMKPFEYHKRPNNRYSSVSSDGGIEDYGNYALEYGVLDFGEI